MPPHFFDLIVQPQRVHPSVASLIQRASGKPSRLMIERACARPDYLVSRSGITVAVEATTANPWQDEGGSSGGTAGRDG